MEEDPTANEQPTELPTTTPVEPPEKAPAGTPAAQGGEEIDRYRPPGKAR